MPFAFQKVRSKHKKPHLSTHLSRYDWQQRAQVTPASIDTARALWRANATKRWRNLLDAKIDPNVHQ